MADSSIAIIVSAFLSFCGVAYTQVQARRAAARSAEIEARKVDAAAYDRARIIDQSIVEGLREEVKRLTERVAELTRALDEEQRDNKALRRELAALERIVARMRRLIAAAEVPVPASLDAELNAVTRSTGDDPKSTKERA